MSAETPASSSLSADDARSPENSGSQDASQSLTHFDQVILEYLRSRGYGEAEQALRDTLESGTSQDRDSSVALAEFVKSLAVYAEKPSRPGENVLKDSGNVLQELTAMNNPESLHALFQSIGEVGAEDLLSRDPTDKHEGFRELESWVDGSLDMYRPEFRPILFPIFCHFYLELIELGYKEAALDFYAKYSPSLAPYHNEILHHLSTILLPSHVHSDDLAKRFKSEKYVVRMSRSGFGLLIGWLTEGVGGEGTGAGDGFSGEGGKKGRAAVMRVVNNRLRSDVTSASSSTVSPHTWEETTGLLSSLLPQTKTAMNGLTNGAAAPMTSAQAFNLSKGDLKLGPAPLSEDLQAETDRVLKEQAMTDPGAQYDLAFARPPQLPGVIAPLESDLLPHPQSFKTIDVTREVEKIRDARKRIRLEPSVLANIDPNSPQAAASRARGLPSICAYTLHDVAEGSPCSTFSADSSLMAAGFSESYIRLWSLRGEKLKGLRSDFQPNNVKDANSLRKIRERGGSTTRKLIGHSGPVYSVDFDPLSGSAAPPKYLLSCSADATTRLWSMDTLTNVAAYRGHENPVWDVKWSPMGVYFSTASRDRTARLWTTDRTSCLRVYAGHLSDVDCVRFHPNSLYLATGSSDWTARLWDVQRGACVRVFLGHQGAVTSLSVSPDGRFLASAGEDLAINLWDLGSGRRIKKMTGHTASIYSLAFSAESSLLVSGGADWTVRCWDVKSPGGLAGKPRENGYTPMGLANGDSSAFRGYGNEDSIETTDLLSTFPTKRTPIVNVQFTPRNLCLVSGSYQPPETR